MDVQRTILGQAMTPLTKAIPNQCHKARTIYESHGVLFLFKDTRLEAQNYVREVLPTLWLIDDCVNKSMKLYNSLDCQWLEYHSTTKLLFLCSIKKS
jgi:hypothetical protein